MTSLHLCMCSVNRNYQLVLDVKSSCVKLCVCRQTGRRGDVWSGGWFRGTKRTFSSSDGPNMCCHTHTRCVACNQNTCGNFVQGLLLHPDGLRSECRHWTAVSHHCVIVGSDRLINYCGMYPDRLIRYRYWQQHGQTNMHGWSNKT